MKTNAFPPLGKIVAVVIVTVSFSFISPAADAARIITIPAVTLEGSWDTNVFNTAIDEKSDFIYRAIPKVSFYIEAFQTSTVLTFGFEFEKYAEYDELDESAATKDLNLSTTEPFRITPRFFVKPSARFVETEDATRRNRLTQTTSPDLPSSESLVTTRTKVREYSAALQLTYLVTPLVELGLGGDGAKRDFRGDDQALEDEDLTDSERYSGEINFHYLFTPRFHSGMFFETSHSTYESKPDSDAYSGGVTMRYLISPSYTVYARVGATYIEESDETTGEDKDDWQPMGNISLTYTWRYFQASLLGAYGLEGGGSFGRTTKRGSVGFTLTNQFYEKWWWDVSGYYQENKSLDDMVTVDFFTVEGTAGLRYVATEWASFMLEGNIFRQRSHGLEGSDLDRDSVFLGVRLSQFYKLY